MTDETTTDEPITDEQWHALVLVRQWGSFREIGDIPFLMAFAILLLFCGCCLIDAHFFRTNTILLAIALCGMFYTLGRLLQKLLIKRFIVRVAPSTYRRLESMDETWFEGANKGYAKELIKAYQRGNPKREYLRPSQATQDETLLRAAYPTDATSQEQLLHPVPTDLRSDLTT